MPDELIYFADPMCSWCWGFAPVMRAVSARYGTRLPIRVVLGGLAPGTREPLDSRGRQTIRDHWDHVAELTGQSFDFGFFERAPFVYDTEPACRAVVAARRLSPDDALGFLSHLQEAFYARNQDVTQASTLAALAASFGLERARFEADFASEATRQETREDFATARRAEVDGYPALIAGSRADGYAFITFGYQPWRRIKGVLESWLATRARSAGS